MKKTLLTLVSVLFCAITFAQSVPQGINYQAVARNASGTELANQSLTVRLSVISGSSTGTISWQEEHSVTTNEFGLFTTVIGQGTSTLSSSLTFNAIGWGAAAHYLKVEIDAGNGYLDMGTNELLSVPYALQAGNPGPAGADGAAGAQGPQGVAGNDGAAGVAGAQGPQGVAGNDGAVGATGADGVDGAVGATGADGQDGVDGAVGAAGAQGPQGVAGNDGTNGIDGAVGAAGIQGPAGNNGTDGINATSLWQDDGIGNVFYGGPISAGGNVGIGTGPNPIRGKLEITGSQQCCSGTQGDFWYYLYNNPNGQFQWYLGTDNFDISVYADGRFMGSGIHIFSDERIKDIVGLSNRKKDLSTLLSLEITDYKMKDKTKGNKPYKKVIAQQVKQVYPQAISLTTEVVPDIYAVATIENGYISLETDLKAGEKVRLIFEDEISLFDVISADKNGFTIDTDKSGKVFVYGREVDDFHSVDYESLSMLNISATQELYKLISQQQKIIENQNTEMAEMQTNFDERLKEIEQILNTTTLNK